MGISNVTPQRQKAQAGIAAASGGSPAGVTSSQGFPDLASLRAALDRIDLDKMVAALEGSRRTGRNPCPRRPILRAHLAARYLGIGNINALRDRLNNDPALRRICGFTDSLPSYPTFWRTFDRLSHMPELIEGCCTALLAQLGEALPNLGQAVAVDATTVTAYANPGRDGTVRNPAGPADPDATWTKKISVRNPAKEEWVFGYKIHAVADANHDIPLGMIVTTASRNDTVMLQPLLEGLGKHSPRFSLRNGVVVIADRGYDSQSNNEFVHRNGGIPVIHKRRPQGSKLHDGIYTTKGVPTCLGKKAMTYIRTDPASGHHLYRCPAGGCFRRGTVFAVSTCDD